MTSIGGLLLSEKHPLQQLHPKKEGGLIFDGGPIFEITVYAFCWFCVQEERYCTPASLNQTNTKMVRYTHT